MSSSTSSTRQRLTTLRAGAAAGIIFAVLFMLILAFVRLSVPADPLAVGAWLPESARSIALALNLLPFAGIAILWFIGVVRERIGALEDRFFATIFLGRSSLASGPANPGVEGTQPQPNV